MVRRDAERHPGADEKEKRYHFFTEWKEKRGAHATYKALVSGLEEIGCMNDVDYIYHLMQSSSTGENKDKTQY